MKTILVDLDSLMDTRLGVLETLDPELAKVVAQRGDYWDREHTDWSVLTNGQLTHDAFLEKWKARDNDTLRASMATNLIPVIAKILADYNQNVQDGMVKEDVTLEVNVWPYALELEEMEDLEAALQYHLYQSLPVTFVSRPMEELTPKVLHDHYAAVIMFDFQPWIKHHCFNIPKQKCPGLNIIVPKLFERDPSQLSTEEKEEEIVGFRIWLMEYVDIDFIDVKWFSLIRPDA